jgi:FKBP-type peptidyl-prolyl cis-trans isomerase SlyD
MRGRGATSIALALALLLAAGPGRAQAPAGDASVQDGSVVRIEYTLRNQASGEVIQTNRGGQPLTYTQGRGQIIPGLERQLAGMRVGEEKKVVVSPEDGYGPADASSRLEVPKAEIPPEAQRVGAHLMARTSEGHERPVLVAEVRETTVVLDLNHPLAGKTLLFDVRVLGIDPPGSPVPAPSAPPPSTR